MTLTLDFQGQILKKSNLRNGMADWHGMRGMWVDSMLVPCCDFQRSPHPWPWPWIFKVKFWKKSKQERGGWLTWNERDVSQTLTSSMILTLDFQGKILKLLYHRNGRVNSLGMKGMRVGSDVIRITLGHGAWQINRPSIGSMWNSYSLQPVGQWMGYSFTDLGAEGCCRSLNALLTVIFLEKASVNTFFLTWAHALNLQNDHGNYYAFQC